MIENFPSVRQVLYTGETGRKRKGKQQEREREKEGEKSKMLKKKEYIQEGIHGMTCVRREKKLSSP